MIPYDKKYLKPLFAGIISFGILHILSQILSSYQLLITGGLLGGGSYAIVLLLLGFEKSDVDLLKSMLPN